MEIIINNQQAVLKEGTSFDFIAENRLFTGSDSYTLTITFPLRGCAQNIAIFGHIHRADVAKNKVVFDCEIRDRDFYRSGTITITEISDVEVKTQFLEGRSEQNFDETFDDIYLNELDLGYPTNREPEKYNPEDDLAHPYPDNDWLSLPWVNNTSGNIQNELSYDSATKQYKWKNVVSTTTSGRPSTGRGWGSNGISFQPYLLYILKRICKEIGYTGDFSALENSGMSYLLICNTLPAAWNAYNFALALSHWTLTEFFEQLEYFLFGDFTINHKQKTIVFQFSDTLITTAGEVQLDKVVDSYTAEVTQEDKSEYLALSNLKYEENDALLWPYLSCDWYIRANHKNAVRFDTLEKLVAAAKQYQYSGVYTYASGRGTDTRYYRGYPTTSEGNKLFLAMDVRQYFVMYCYKSELVAENVSNSFMKKAYKYHNRLQPVNIFGERFADKDANDIEMKIVPAWIEDTGDEHGNMLFLNCGEMGSSDSWTLTADGTSTEGTKPNRVLIGSSGDSTLDYDGGALAQGTASLKISKSEKNGTDAYFDNIFIGFWDGSMPHKPYMPHPIISNVEITNNFEIIRSPHTLSLNEGSAEQRREAMYQIDGKKKYQFSFLSDTLPNPRALYYIRGGKYVCEKITATFKESGMSQLLKGTFYRVLDEDE